MNYVLVVDDSPLDRHVVTRLIEQHFPYWIEFATTGWEALEHIESSLPMVVVTDLQMPEMDGLQLIDNIRRFHGAVPVILMTAYGSEDVAAEALSRGAADYVPKPALATELCPAIKSVLEITGDLYGEHRIQDLLRYEEVTYELTNDHTLIPPLVRRVQQAALRMQLVDAADAIRLAKALSEGLRNAIDHGDLELSANDIAEARASTAGREAILHRQRSTPWSDRRVCLTSSISPARGRFTICDQGPGFDTSALPDFRRNPSYLCNMERRGLILIQAFMDEVQFNERGNGITMTKRKQVSSPSTPNVSTTA